MCLIFGLKSARPLAPRSLFQALAMLDDVYVPPTAPIVGKSSRVDLALRVGSASSGHNEHALPRGANNARQRRGPVVAAQGSASNDQKERVSLCRQSGPLRLNAMKGVRTRPGSS